MSAPHEIPFECDCGEIFTAKVSPESFEPVGGLYGPCPECGRVTPPRGFPFEPPSLGWRWTGQIRSRAHLAFVEEFQTVALCGVGIISEGSEIRPKRAGWCHRCVKLARESGVDPATVGLFDPDISDTGSPETD